MGTACAPSYANNFMAKFEEKHIYLFIKDKIKRYVRYIDGLFLFRRARKKKWSPFFKFDQKYSKSEIEFLNVLVYKDEQQRLQVSLFRRKTCR